MLFNKSYCNTFQAKVYPFQILHNTAHFVRKATFNFVMKGAYVIWERITQKCDLLTIEKHKYYVSLGKFVNKFFDYNL